MADGKGSGFLPLEFVFNPNWWHRTAGISFDRPFYFHGTIRVQYDMIMRRVLHKRYGDIGLGQKDPQPRPVAGSLHVAGGFIIPALLGAEVAFAADAAPQPLPFRLTKEQIDALEKPDFLTTSPMTELIASWNEQQAEYGYLIGDLNTDGVLNAAYHFCGQDLFADFYDAPGRVRHILEVIADLIVDVASYVRGRTGSCSIAVNRMAKRVDPRLFIHANCSVQMISPRSYRSLHLAIEKRMAERIQPFGIHHCGNNMHQVAAAYAETGAAFYDVGWGSDITACRKVLPDAFFNLRLSPMRMLQRGPAEMAADVEKLLLSAGPLDKAGVCCINMDYGTPDDNLFAVFEVVERYRRYGA